MNKSTMKSSIKISTKLITLIATVFFLTTAIVSHADPQDPPKTYPTTLKFSHELHLSLTPAKCTYCHNLNSKDPYPAMDKCGKCHASVRAKDDSPDCLICHTNKDDFSVVYPKDTREKDPDGKRLWGGIRSNFSHTAMETHAQSDCTTCHTNIYKSANSGDDNFPKRADCGQCHKVYDDPSHLDPKACAICHKMNTPAPTPVPSKPTPPSTGTNAPPPKVGGFGQ